MKRFLAIIVAGATALSLLAVSALAAVERPRRVTISGPKSVSINRTIQLDFKVIPDDIHYDNWEWSSSDYDVADVDDSGEVFGVDNGTATIRVRLYANDPDNGGKAVRIGTGEVEITVGRPAAGSTNSPDTVTAGSSSAATTGSSTSSSAGAAIRTGGAVPSATVTAAVKGALVRGGSTSTIFKNYDSVSAAALQAAGTAMSGGTVLLHFDTSGSVFEGRLTINPKDAAKLTSAVNVGLYTSSDQVSGVQKTFEKYFKNSVTIIRATQSGSYGMTVGVAAKVSATLARSSDLRLYSYDVSSGTYQEIKDAGIRIDANGYAHFSTTSGGYLVLSDGALAKR